MSQTPRAVAPSLNGWNAEYLDAQYQQYRTDPDALPPDLVHFFQGFDLALSRSGPAASAPGASPPSTDALRLHLGVAKLIEAYRRYGHFHAKTDPFGSTRPGHPSTALAYNGLLVADLDRPVDVGTLPLPAQSTLRQVVDFLERTYAGPIGAEFMQIADDEERLWLIARFEQTRLPLTPDQKTELARQMVRSDEFEQFLQRRFPGEKRFSIEGGETLIPCINWMIDTAARSGVEEVEFGMPHRARINVLAHIMGKSYHQILTEFEDTWHDEITDIGGDVAYHQGYATDRALPGGKSIHLTLSPNPSHLESVNGVVEGRARGKQRLRHDSEERRKVVPVLMHGDAAVIGQGIVAEVLNYSRLEGYETGGTVHIVVNNLVGFTTGIPDARSGKYCTDVAHIISAPVFHVNADDPEAVVWLAELAIDYRQRFRKDLFIDLVCYRKYGHNEQDDASITQPLMAAAIRARRGPAADYAARLVSEGVLPSDAVDAMRTEVVAQMDRAQELAKDKPACPYITPFGGRWKGISWEFSFDPVNTAVTSKTLDEVVAALGRHPPDSFKINPKLEKVLRDRGSLMETRQISYADAEALAYGTLLLEGHAIRLSGQDSKRGTFAHRMAVMRDIETEESYTPLNSMRPIAEHPEDCGKPGPDGRPTQARLCVYDSPLSEVSVMAFDYGYSTTDPNMLVLWEAQFGDFNNGAQTIIDQYIASSPVKWKRFSGLTLLLPHGYEGKGPEHSSARLERFLSLCADNNMLVVNPSTGPQAFHMLRRQVKASFRRPLIVMTPKSMLRINTGTIDELMTGQFREVLDDPMFVGGEAYRKSVRHILLCTGKIFHELVARRKETGRTDTAIIRIEQLYPLHTAMLAKILAAYPTSLQVDWVQEEPRNAGAYLFVADVLRTDPALKIDLGYIGRPATSSPAVGSKHRHLDQQAEILARALPGDAAPTIAPKDAPAAPGKSATPKAALPKVAPAAKAANGKAGHAAPKRTPAKSKPRR